MMPPTQARKRTTRMSAEWRSGLIRAKKKPATRAIASRDTPRIRAISAITAPNRPAVADNFAIQSKQLSCRFVFGQGAFIAAINSKGNAHDDPVSELSDEMHM